MGVRVNAILPGYVATDIVRSLVDNQQVDPTQVNSRIPLGRMADVDEIAEPIVWAAGNTYLNGALLPVDGGYHAFGGSGPASVKVSPPPSRQDQAVIAINGGAAGVGAAIAGHYLRKGARVIILDRDIETLRSIPSDRIGIHLDVTDHSSVISAFSAISERFKNLDVLINTDASPEPNRSCDERPLKQFHNSLKLNLMAPFAVAQAAAKVMMNNTGGVIINVASTSALDERENDIVHSSTNSGIAMMTRSLACEWASAGIRVNAVTTGHIQTSELTTPINPRSLNPQATRQKIAMNRFALPEEIADAVAFLTSPRSSYVTGSVYIIDGGRSVLGDTANSSNFLSDH